MPLPPTSLDLSSDSQKLNNEETEILCTNHATDVRPKKFTQGELNDLIRDLNPSKQSSPVLGSRLQNENLLAARITFSWYRYQEKEFTK